MDQFVQVEGLEKDTVGPCPFGSTQGRCVLARGDEDDGHFGRHLAQPLRSGNAVAARHRDVGDDEKLQALPRDRHRKEFDPVARLAYMEARTQKRRRHQAAQIVVVIRHDRVTLLRKTVAQSVTSRERP